jgi:hypothetical protein
MNLVCCFDVRAGALTTDSHHCHRLYGLADTPTEIAARIAHCLADGIVVDSYLAWTHE